MGKNESNVRIETREHRLQHPDPKNRSMALPERKTCGDCHRFAQCHAFCGVDEKNEVCDWFPNLFYEKGVTTQWIIYGHPKDHPDDFVVRRWNITAGGEPVPSEDCNLAPSLLEARTYIPRGLYKLPASPIDDPVIVEVWI